MGLNVDFILEPEIEEAHPESDIRSVLWNLEPLDALANEGGVTSLGEFGLAYDEDDDEEGVEDDDRVLFSSKEGIKTIEFLLTTLRSKPKDKKERARLEKVIKSLEEGPEFLLVELEELLQCLKTAAKKKAKFRFILV